MEKKPFQAESKRLLDLMVNSIYTHKEIFLRELISNASDAIDKYYIYSLENGKSPEDLRIQIVLDEAARTLSISDNGIGMSEQEMEENLGTIAKSGSLAFKKALEQKDDRENVDIIGQFGVGFYSAFMVADEVSVISRSAASDQAWEWKSNGSDGFTISPAVRSGHGTSVVLHVKEDDDMESFSQYLNSEQVRALITKYSDFIRYPIHLNLSVEESLGEKESAPVNSMIPLWKRPKSEITQQDFNEFYRSHFDAYGDPLDTIYFNVEGRTSFTALLFIPGQTPANFYTREYPYGLQLYSKGVFIESHCEALLPSYLRFVSGLVDAQDLSLNISREMLQHDYQLRTIEKRIEKKVLDALKTMLRKDRPRYETFWKHFGLDIKIGAYEDFGIRRNELEDLLMFQSSINDTYVTLAEYVEHMKPDQEAIFYASGNNPQLIAKMPAVRALLEKDIPVLYLTGEVDEFVLEILAGYKEHPFRNALQGNFDLSSEEEKKVIEQQEEQNKELLDYIQSVLPEVQEVRLSSRMGDEAVLLVAGDGISFEMERILARMNENTHQQPTPFSKATRILEINPTHAIWNVLKAQFGEHREIVKTIAEVLYDQALLIEGFSLSDPLEYSRKVLSLLDDLKK